MRLFIAVDFEPIRDTFLGLQNFINTKNFGASFTRSFHLTLKFLGDVDEGQVEEIKERLSKIKFNSFNVKLDKVGVFHSFDYIRVIWVGLWNEDKLEEMHKQVDEALTGIFLKEKNFKSHITLARVKFVKDKEKAKEEIMAIAVPDIKFKVDKFKLMESHLSPKGARYDELAIYKAQK